MDKIIEAVFRKDILTLENKLDTTNVNSYDREKRTPLIHACIDGQLNIVELLIAKGADVNLPDKFGWGPLHYAVQSESNEILLLLLQHGADVNHLDSDGNSPLWRAVFSFNGDTKIIKTLIEFGANKNQTNTHGVPISELILRKKAKGYLCAELE